MIEQLLDLAMDHARRIGVSIDADVSLQGQPAHPMLTLQISCRDGLDDATTAEDPYWRRFVLLARARNNLDVLRCSAQTDPCREGAARPERRPPANV